MGCCEHEPPLINSELVTVMDGRNCREIGETNYWELRIHGPSLIQGRHVVGKCAIIVTKKDLIGY